MAPATSSPKRGRSPWNRFSHPGSQRDAARQPPGIQRGQERSILVVTHRRSHSITWGTCLPRLIHPSTGRRGITLNSRHQCRCRHSSTGRRPGTISSRRRSHFKSGRRATISSSSQRGQLNTGSPCHSSIYPSLSLWPLVMCRFRHRWSHFP